MKILNHGAMTGSAVRDFPELTLAAAFREAGTDYGHGSYAAYGKRVLDLVLVFRFIRIRVRCKRRGDSVLL